MKLQHSALFAVFLLLFLLTSDVVFADVLRTQSISLHQGWNAVYLQVAPTNSKPMDCFQGTPVTVVASYVGNGSAVQFVQNPSTNTINGKNGWLVWYAPTRPDAFLSRLFGLSGNTAYLIYAQSDFVWSVTGSVSWSTMTWRSDSFNLVGFGVDELSPPTFDQFFDSSAAHHPYRIYRLINDQWVLVDRAQTTPMRANEACWIYCKGTSEYQGPLGAKIQGGQTLRINGSNPAGVLLANESRNPLAVRVQNMDGSAVPLGFVLRAITDSNLVTATYDLPAVYNAPVFEPGEKRGLWLILRPERMALDSQPTLLKITTDLGTQCWLPITGYRAAVNSAN